MNRLKKLFFFAQNFTYFILNQLRRLQKKVGGCKFENKLEQNTTVAAVIVPKLGFPL